MTLRNRKELKQQSRYALENARCDHRKLVLLHTGGVLAINLLVTLILYAINSQVTGTGGLAGMQTRAVWSTLQQLLLVAVPFFTMLWDASYYSISIGLSQRQPMSPKDLLKGFQHPLSVLGCNLWPTLQYLARGVLAIFGASFLFSMTPLARPLVDFMDQLPTQLVDGQSVYVMDEAAMASVTELMWPVMIFFVIVLIPLVAPVFYRYRLSLYLLLDNKEPGTMNALRGSRWRMQGRRIELFKLDLSFWWYYLLQGLAVAVCYLDLWLPKLGVELPFSGIGLSVGTYILYAVCQLALDLWKKNEVQTTYALAYETIRSTGEPTPWSAGEPTSE